MFNSIKHFLLNFETIKIFLFKIYQIINPTITIIKSGDYWIHKKDNNYYINFHPMFNLRKFIKNYKIFTKHYIPKKGDVVFDIGSGLGSELIHFSKLVGKNGKIFSIESDPRLYKLLLKIIELNKIKNVYLFNSFFFNKNNIVVKSRLSPINDWMSNSINKKKGKIIKSKTLSLDYLVKKHNLKKINFAKFNIEGSEINLSSGNETFLKKCKNLAVSCHDFIDAKGYKTYKILFDLLTIKKFKIYENKSENRIYKYFIYAKSKNN